MVDKTQISEQEKRQGKNPFTVNFAQLLDPKNKETDKEEKPRTGLGRFTSYVKRGFKKLGNKIALSKFGQAAKKGYTKVANSKFGRGIKTAVKWASSKGVIRAFNIIVPALAFAGIGALSGGIVPAVALGLAGGAMLYNSIRDTNSLRRIKRIEKEHGLLVDQKQDKAAEKALLEHLKLQGKGSIENLNAILDKATPQLADAKKAQRLAAQPTEIELDPGGKRALGKATKDALVETTANAATVATIATSGLPGAMMNAVSVGGPALVLGVADVVISAKQKRKYDVLKNAMRRNIDRLKRDEDIPPYAKSSDLARNAWQQKIRTEALARLSEDVRNNPNLIGEALEKKLEDHLEKIKQEPDFAEPKKPGFFGKVKQYFKDFNSIHWPSEGNKYYNPDDLAVKLNDHMQASQERYNAAVVGKELITQRAQEREKTRSRQQEQEVSRELAAEAARLAPAKSPNLETQTRKTSERIRASSLRL